MWNYEKRLQYPVNITQTNPQIAQVIISQFGGPDGELSASMRYLSQRYTMPYREVAGLLTDIGTEAPEMFQKPTLRAFCTFHIHVAPLKRERLQIHVNMPIIIHHHFISKMRGFA